MVCKGEMWAVSNICRLQTNSADKQYLSLRTHLITVSFQLLKANRFKMGF